MSPRMHSGAIARNYLAFDFGAESGRAVLAHLRDGMIRFEEIHRFPNEPVRYGSSLHWDVARLWWEMRRALSSVEDRLDTGRLDGIGVDAWGIDYALLRERRTPTKPVPLPRRPYSWSHGTGFSNRQ